MKITGAIFDMDGTLIDSLGFWDILWEKLGETYLGDKSFRPDPVTERAVRTSTLYDAAAIIHRNCGIGESEESLFKTVDALLLWHYEENVEMKKGAIDFLEYLLSRGVRMCVATATAPHLLEVLMKKFGLKRFFPRVFSCNDVGHGKESPAVFDAAHAWLGGERETTFVFEDSVVAVETAVKAGYKVVGVYDKYGFAEEKIEALSTVYIDKNTTLSSLKNNTELF